MSGRMEVIKHKENEIVFLNYANLNENNYIRALDETMDFINKQEDIFNRLVLIDVTDLPITAKVLE